MIAHLLRFSDMGMFSQVENRAGGLFCRLQNPAFIENSMAGNDRNLDIQSLLTYNLFVILCPAGGCGKEAVHCGKRFVL